MKRDRTTHASTCYTWEPENYAGDIPARYDFRLTATLTPYSPGDYTEPPSGATCEITDARLLAVHTEGRTYPGAGEPRREALEREFLAWLEQPAQAIILDNLEERLFAEAAARDLAMREEAAYREAERRAEWRKRRLEMPAEIE